MMVYIRWIPKYALLYFSLFTFICLHNRVFGQERVVTAGFQYKPLFSSKFFKTGPQELIWNAKYYDTIPQLIYQDSAFFKISPESGYCIGMVIRAGLSDTWSLETGINFVRRNYQLDMSDSTGSESTDFSLVSYQIPFQALVFIQLSDQVFMDVSMGVAADFYPSDIATYGDRFIHSSARLSWLSASLLANIGWEYRTTESGYFYLGASYNRPFNSIMRSFFKRPTTDYGPEEYIDLKGNYLTVDLRYFFHSDPVKRKSKKR
ncbi:MAG: outer membrane beta-barrel protein [Bacteroidota bacterium]